MTRRISLRAFAFLCVTATLLGSTVASSQERDRPREDSACCGYTVEGYKYFDLDGNGVIDGGDYPLSGWTIEAADSTGTVVATTVTDSTGYYSFYTPVGCGWELQLQEVPVSGWTQSFPGGDGKHVDTVGGCGAVLGPYNFLNTDPVCQDFTKTYTLDADFNEGALAGVVTAVDQLELAPTGTTFEFAWIANAGEGTVSKVSTVTGNEVARYYTGPPDGGGDYMYLTPSRTAIDGDGNCWVANRTPGGIASVTQILVTGGDDRNANTTIETSFDASANGMIETTEMLPWGDDERVVRHYLTGSGPPEDWARGLAVDKAGFLWVGLYNGYRVLKVDPTLSTAVYGPDMPPSAPPELASVDLSAVGVQPYGLALSPSGMLYAASNDRAVEIDPGLASGGTAAGPAVTQHIVHTDHYNYGIAVDQDCVVWLAKIWATGYGEGAIRWDPSVGVGDPSLGWAETTPGASAWGRGITVDFDGNIWMAGNDSLNSVVKFDGAGNFLANYPTGLAVPVGVGAGPDENMIVVGSGSNSWTKLDKDTGAVIPLAGPQLVGTNPYTYSDFTGSLQNIVSQQQGFWTVVTDGGYAGLSWVLIDWTDLTPPGTSVQVEARTAFTLSGLASEPWAVVFPPGPLGSPLPGRYIETRVRLQRERDCGDAFITPVLYDLTVAAVCDSCYIVTCPEDVVVACDSQAGATVTYVEPVPNHECDATWVTTCTPPSGSVFPIGTTTVDCVSVNATGDSLFCNFQVTVTDECVVEPTGACCFENTVCDELTQHDCLHLGGVYLGDGTDCATVDCNFQCVRPPFGLVAWWPLDDAPGGITPNLADPGTGGSLVGTPTNVAGVYVTASYLFNGIDEYVNVPDDPTVDLGPSDFSVDFWIKTDVAQGVSPVLDKRQSQPVRGYRVFLQDGYPALQMADLGGSSIWALDAANGGPAAFVADGSWHFVAITVDRSVGNGIRFYVDGIPVGTPADPTPRSGGLSNTANLVLARSYPIGGPDAYLNGSLDEVELFRRVLTLADISSVHRSGSAGKCRETCYATTRAVCCDGDANGAITICNYDVVAHVYSYGLNPVSGAGCGGLGVTTFDPNSGTVTVGPGECLTIPIDMVCPTDVFLGQESCYEATIYNHDTGALFGCKGSVRRPAWWCIKWDTVAKPVKGMVSIPPQADVLFNLFIQHVPVVGPVPDPPVLPFTLHPVEADGVTPSPSLGLNGLPPGEPVVRGPEIPPEGYNQSLRLRFETHQPLSFQRVVLMADDDMDGVPEPIAEFAVRSDNTTTTAVGDDTDEDALDGALRPFLALPNPFNRSGKIRFRVTGEGQQRVSLQLFDLRGREIKRFYRKLALEPGIHEVDWNGTNGYGVPLPNGVYFLRLESAEVKETVKVVLMREAPRDRLRGGVPPTPGNSRG